MKFEDFNLDLTKLMKGYGVNPLDAGCDEDVAGSGTGTATTGCHGFTYEPKPHGCYTDWKKCPN